MEPAPHYHGHRDRLHGRFTENGAEALEDYELLELGLSFAMPRRDVKQLAKTLLARFGSLSTLLHTPIKDLSEAEGMTESAALALSVFSALALRTEE